MTTVVNALTLFKLIFAHLLNIISALRRRAANNGIRAHHSSPVARAPRRLRSTLRTLPARPVFFHPPLEKSSATSFAVHFALSLSWFSSLCSINFLIKSNDPWCWCLSATNNVSSISFAASSASSAESRDLSLLVVVFDDDVGGGGCLGVDDGHLPSSSSSSFWSHLFLSKERGLL